MSTITFLQEDNYLVLRYHPEQNPEWVYKEFQEEHQIWLKGVFHFNRKDIYNSLEEIDFNDPFSEREYDFILGELEGGYYKVKKEILSIENNLYLYEDLKFEEKFFIATGRISVFRELDRIVKHDIYVGGNNKNALPVDVFNRLLKDFPNDTEIQKYRHARISAVMQDYFTLKKDYQKQYEKYLNTRRSKPAKDITNRFRKNEGVKFQFIRNTLYGMLKNSTSYNEKTWQIEILEIILLLFPKYVKVFMEAPVKDSFKGTNKRIDYLLVDASGNVDIIEIKKPFDECIVTDNKYRGNYIQMKELSGTIMQIEKYILYLNKWGSRGEEILTCKFKDYLPNDINIQITNPGGIIIMGRTNRLSPEQLRDFEIIKRQYKNIIDIITYDDLLKRLDAIISQLTSSTHIQELSQ